MNKEIEFTEYNVLVPRYKEDVKYHLEKPNDARETLCGRDATNWRVTGEQKSEAFSGLCMICRNVLWDKRFSEAFAHDLLKKKQEDSNE